MNLDLSQLFELTFFEGRNVIRKMVCREHQETIIDLSLHPTNQEIDEAVVAVRAHLEIRHGIATVARRCTDPDCKTTH